MIRKNVDLSKRIRHCISCIELRHNRLRHTFLMKRNSPHPLQAVFALSIITAATAALTSGSSSAKPSSDTLPISKNVIAPNARIRIGPKQTGLLPGWRNRNRTRFPD